MDDVSLSSLCRLPDDSSGHCESSGADDRSCSLCRQFHGVGRAQMMSTGYCRDQDTVVCQIQRGKTVKALEDDHGKLELYSLPDGKPAEVAQYRCDVVELSCAGHNVHC